jgi:hypothetical protein
MYVGSDLISHMHSSGSRAIVKAVEAKPDRIEIRLEPDEASGDNPYMKLKLMLGKGYESRSLEQIEMVLARTLFLPRIASIQTERATLKELGSSIAELERELATATDAQVQVEEGTRLVTLYQERESAQERLSRVVFEPVSAEQVTSRITELKRTIAAGQRQAVRDKLDAASNQYSASAMKMKSDCDRLPRGTVQSRAELTLQINSVADGRGDINQFEIARKGMVGLGQAVPQPDEDYAAKCSASYDLVAQSFPTKEDSVNAAETRAAEAQRQAERSQQLARADEDFRKLNKQKASLVSKMVTVLGGSEENATYSAYKNLLKQMVRNRQQAQALGSRSAESEGQRIVNQLQKLGY